MAERDTADRQLARWLHILPSATRDGGAGLDELARELDVELPRLVKDITALTERAYYHPAGSGDDLQVLIGPDRVSIWTKHEFRRPVRLTPAEALCVALGVRGRSLPLAVDGGDGAAGPDTRGNGRDLRSSIEQQLAFAAGSEGRAAGASVAAPELAPDEEGMRTGISEALRDRRPCRFGYLKDGAESPEVREMEPWALVHAEGHWYAIGRDTEAGAPRAFRLDRVLGLELRDGAYEIPDGVDPADFVEGARLFLVADDATPALARIRYSSAIARWIRERWAEGEDRADGSYVVSHLLLDPGWAVRHVLSYGAEAEVLEPPELREVVRETVDRLRGGAAQG